MSDTHRVGLTTTVGQSLRALDHGIRDGAAFGTREVSTGFTVLDEILGGGLHGGDLILLGGPPGVGKTICALQWARNMARSGHRAIFACYEHTPNTLLTRLLALESGEAGGDTKVGRVVEQALAGSATDGAGLEELLQQTALGAQALASVESYGDELVFLRASGSHSTVEELRQLATPHVTHDGNSVLFVDYLQKIPIHPEPATEAEKITRTVEALKDLALDLQIPIVLLSAVDADGMRASRIRMHHLRGSSAIAFESDVVLMLNDKLKAVSKVHLSYDPVGAREFRNWIVMSIEKNRGGPNLIDLEFRKDFAHFRFDPDGGIVSEKLVDERLDEAGL